MDITEVISNIVDQRLAELSFGPPAEPQLIKTSEAAKLCGCSSDIIIALAHDTANNGFPAVWLSSKTLRIDKHRLAKWFASGGLGVKV